MSGWGGGYVTDITYTAGWYRQQSPAMMALACLLGGVAADLPGPDDPVQYMELGCGQGLSAMLLAASNPSWRVTAVDFNPAHIASAREWAAAGGLNNIEFIEANLTTMAEDPAGRALPQMDFVSLHGVWSWVPPAVQAGIVRLIGDKLRPGGVMHVSYNSLPGWGAALGMQRVLRSVGQQSGWRSDRQAEQGLKFVHELYDAEATQFRRSSMVKAVLDRIESFPPQYLSHEYMNENWQPCYLADVAAAFAGAKMEWVASSQLPENFNDLMLTEAQRKLAQRFDDPLLRELIKDVCVERTLRHDVFVRGARRISSAARDAALNELSIALAIPAKDLPLHADMPAGKAELKPEFYQPIVQALVAGPRRVGDLLRLEDVVGKRDNPAELIGVLVGMDVAEPALRPAAAPNDYALRFNRVTARRLAQTESLGRALAMASHRLGAAAKAALLDLVAIDRTLDGEGSVEDLMRYLASGGSDHEKLRQALEESVNHRLPVLRAEGVF